MTISQTTSLIDHAAHPRASLALFAALLNLNNNDASFRRAFQSLNRIFQFDTALVLEGSTDGLTCIASLPEASVGQHWPGISLPGELDVLALPARGDTEDAPTGLAALVNSGQAALFLPIVVDGQVALLGLLRDAGRPDFTDVDVAVAKQCTTLALAMLAVHKGASLEAEVQRLSALVAREDGRDGDAPLTGPLLKQVVDHLPVGLTIQDHDGQFIFVNEAAAASLGMSSETLIGASPGDFLPAAEAASRHEWEQELIRTGKEVTFEAGTADQQGERIWLTSTRAIGLADETFLVSSSIDITEHKRVQRELIERSQIDELTGLPNRTLIRDRIESMILEHGGKVRFALAVIDLDNFKDINEYYSHAIGDALLKKMAQRITNVLRPGDMVARISGDEFLLLLEPIDDAVQVKTLVDSLLEELRRPLQIEMLEMFVSCSLGISTYPEHGHSYETLRTNAASAMYRAKEVAKGGAIFFDHDMAQALTARMAAEQRLRLAVQDRKFCCAFQPKVDIQSREVVGFEALVRWRDENGEVHSPGEFIGLAIELGLINPITTSVLTEAINSIDRLDAAYGPDTTISVNVAATQASDLNYMRSLVELLKDSGRAHRFIVELTEEALIDKGPFRTQVLPMLREIGVRVSIDDFGTGYSSLSILADITADEIKIDRSFITSIHRRPRNQSVLRAIESIGHALGMTIVAEGVETYEELAYLHAATRVRYAQGFYFSKPFFLEDLGAQASPMGRTHEASRGQAEPDVRAQGRTVAPARASD